MDQDMQERIAYLERELAELSDVVARQDKVIDTLTARVQMLMQREAAREMDSGGSVPLADQKPPHW